MDKKPYKAKKCRPPDLDKFIKPEWKHYYVSYAQGAKMYSLNYWPFVRLATDKSYGYIFWLKACVSRRRVE